MTPLDAALAVLALVQVAAALMYLAAAAWRSTTVRASMSMIIMASALLMIMLSVPPCYVGFASVQTVIAATWIFLTPTTEGTN